MVVQRKTLNYQLSIHLDYGTNDKAVAAGKTYGATTGIGGALDVDYYDAHNGDREVVSIIYGLEPYFNAPISAVHLTATYGLRDDDE